MDKIQLDKYKELLLREKNRLLSTINEINKNDLGGSLKEFNSELSSYDNHPADMGTETFMMQQSMNLKTNEINILQDIDNALKNIDEGTYGLCSKCGKEIENERLDVLPYVDTCKHCMDNEDIKEKNFRPVEEGVLGFPFSRMRSTITEKVGVDGEDIHQDVLKYNKMNLDLAQTGDNQGVFDEFNSGALEGTHKIIDEDDI